MKRQNRSDALKGFFKPLLWLGAILFVANFAFNHSQNNDVVSTRANDSTVAHATESKSLSENQATDDTSDYAGLTEIDLSDFKENHVLFEMDKATFTITDAYLEDDHIILTFEFINKQKEPVKPIDEYRDFVDGLTQEDDNAIYDVDINHFYDIMGEKEVEKLSNSNPQIKPDGKFEFYVPYELVDESDVTIHFEDDRLEPLVIIMD